MACTRQIFDFELILVHKKFDRVLLVKSCLPRVAKVVGEVEGEGCPFMDLEIWQRSMVRALFLLENT